MSSLTITTKKILRENKNKVEKYLDTNNEKHINYLIGLILQETDGSYNPNEISN